LWHLQNHQQIRIEIFLKGFEQKKPDGVRVSSFCTPLRDPNESTPKIKLLLHLCHEPIFNSLQGRRSQHPSLMDPQFSKLLMMEWIWVEISK
jgi:hypothetical protein